MAQMERAYEWLTSGMPTGALFEVRVLRPHGAPLSGLFTHPSVAARATSRYADGQAQVYHGLNPRRTGGAVATNRLRPGVGGKAHDVEAICHVLLDFDPVRPAGVASNAEELEAAHKRAREADAWLRGQGFLPPLAILSGNGYHLVAKIPPQVDVTGFSRRVRVFLREMSKRFSDEIVQVDTAVFDAPRIAKSPGALSIKGDPTPERPHRRAEVLRWVPLEPDGRLAEYIATLAPIEEERDAIDISRERGYAPKTEEDLRETLAGCTFLQHCRENAKRLPEPIWYAMITNLVTFGPRADAAIHDLSRPYPAYSREETQRKIEHARNSSPGPHTCETIADLGFRCPHLDSCPAAAPAAYATAGRSEEGVMLPPVERLTVETLAQLPPAVHDTILRPVPKSERALALQQAALAMRAAGYNDRMALHAIISHAIGQGVPRREARAAVEIAFLPAAERTG